VVTLVQLTGAA